MHSPLHLEGLLLQLDLHTLLRDCQWVAWRWQSVQAGKQRGQIGCCVHLLLKLLKSPGRSCQGKWTNSKWKRRRSLSRLALK